MDWHLVGCLVVLRVEVDDVFPNRPTVSDGTIGNADHSALVSDHNPTSSGAVCAWDITEGDAAETLRAFTLDTKPAAVKYEISRRRIRSPGGNAARSPWTWGWYGGINPHETHMHLSVHEVESRAPWGFVDWCRTRRLGRFATDGDDMALPYEVDLDRRYEDVERWQYLLKATVEPDLVPDGVFGPATLAALRKVRGNSNAARLDGLTAYRLDAQWTQEMARRASS